MRKKSLKVNAILNAAKNILSVIFPFITFPYASKVLQVDNIGKVNFASSILTYFILMASLGVSNYAVREGSGLREDKAKLNRFVSEIFTINMVSTAISYLALFACIYVIPKLKAYKPLLLLLSIEIIFVTLGMEWIYTIYEEYLYITIRSILFQVISIVLLFVMVKSQEDYLQYALISVIAGVGANLLNFINAGKYCTIRLNRHMNLKKHLKPIMVIFSITLATTIYVSSDLTMLGFMLGDYYVGLYSVAAKIYRIVKNLLGAMLIVSVPRLSYYYSRKMTADFEKTLTNILNALVLLVLPTVTGLVVLSREIVYIIAGESFSGAAGAMVILSIALIFCLFAWFFSQCILMPYRCESTILYTTILSAVLNIILNFIMIPVWKHYAAAFSTAVAEAVTMMICFQKSRKLVKLHEISHNLITAMAGCLSIIIVSIVLRGVITNMILYAITTVFLSIITYGTVQIVLRNELVLGYIRKRKQKEEEKEHGVRNIHH